MWETLTTKIKMTLGKVSNVKDYFCVPKANMTKFPAVFFKPAGFNNDFETQNENKAVYRFMMLVLVGIKGTNMTIDQAFETVLPHTVDAIIAQFNTDWNAGTVDGHRITVKIDSADAWQISQEEDGEIAYAPLNLEIRLLTSN